MHDLLTDSILVLHRAEGDSPGTLPDALAGLCGNTLIGFDGLAAHQRHGWDLFLYQIAALALERSGAAEAVADDTAWRALDDPRAWRDRLAALTPGCAETAWSLVVQDLAKPALLQPPIGGGRLDDYKIAGETPDEIDVLVTSKDHDVKAARAGAAEPRHWLFALVTLQTLQGYSGRGNFGIARMNGGFASRPLVMRTPDRSLAACFRGGVRAALKAREAALNVMNALFSPEGLGLLWLEPWDREDGIATRRLDPLFVEICRRIRLVPDGQGRVIAWGRPSAAARVTVPKDSLGNLGDAWTPISATEGAALTVGAGGFDYRLIARLLDVQDFVLPVAAEPRRDDPAEAVWLRAAVLVRGQGKTEGLHERWVQLPGRASRETLGKLSQAMVKQAAVAKEALKSALLTFLQGAPAKLDFKDRRADAALDVFEQDIDGIFFVHLFARAQAGEDDEADAEAAWKAVLTRLARRLFTDATAELSPPHSRREKAQAVAELLLNSKLRRAQLLPQPSETEEETHDDAA